MARDEIRAYRTHLKATDTEIEAFSLRLKDVFKEGLRDILKRLKRGDDSLIETLSVLGNVETALRELGLENTISRSDKIYLSQLRFIEERFEAAGKKAQFSNIDRDVIDALITFDQTDVGTKVGSHIKDFTGEMARSIIIGETPDFETAISESGDSLERNVYNYTRTAVLSFERTVTVKKSLDLGFDLFIYIGPEDDVTRDFCQGLLDRDPPIYTLDEIREMDNGQGLDVLTSGGGYNCRHSWNPISEERAVELGWADPDDD